MKTLGFLFNLSVVLALVGPTLFIVSLVAFKGISSGSIFGISIAVWMVTFCLSSILVERYDWVGRVARFSWFACMTVFSVCLAWFTCKSIAS